MGCIHSLNTYCTSTLDYLLGHCLSMPRCIIYEIKCKQPLSLVCTYSYYLYDSIYRVCMHTTLILSGIEYTRIKAFHPTNTSTMVKLNHTSCVNFAWENIEFSLLIYSRRYLNATITNIDLIKSLKHHFFIHSIRLWVIEYVPVNH